MKLVLHIGTEKTGTTSFQNWMAANQASLLQEGIWYCQTLGRKNHLKMYLACIDPEMNNRGFDLVRLSTLEERRKLRSVVETNLKEEAEKAFEAGAKYFVISNEHCHSHLRRQEDVDRAANLLNPIFKEIEVVCFLRPQIDVAVSLASTAARAGHVVSETFFEDAADKKHFYKYENLYAMWSWAFQSSRVTLVPFARWPDTIDYFCDVFRLDRSRYTQAAYENQALDIRLIALFNRLSGQQPTKLNKQLMLSGDIPCIEKIQPGEETARKFQSRFTYGNKLIAENSLIDVKYNELEPDWEKYKAPQNLYKLSLSDNQLMLELAFMVSQVSQKQFTP